MTKTLDTAGIQNDLNGSVFFPYKERVERPDPAAQVPQKPTTQHIPERPNTRTGERPNGRRFIARKSFEIYEDQMDSLRNLAFEEVESKGRIGSMSAMVRDAIDTYIEKRSSEK